MGITPITNLPPLPVTRAIENELEPQPMQKVESTARTDDETYSPSQQSLAQDSEEEGQAQESRNLAADAEDAASGDVFQSVVAEEEAQPSPQPADESSTGRISFLA